MAISKPIEKHLAKIGLKYDTVPHRPVFTVYDLAQTLKIKLNEIAKTLLIKGDKQLVLAVLPAHRRLNLVAVKKALGVKTVSLASEKDMVNKLKVKPGAVTAFGSWHKLPVLLDRSLLKTTKALFAAGSFTDAVRVKIKDYVKTQAPQTAPIAEAKKK
jgi:Ala-tRNA(Pro) deacylase